MTSPTIPTVNGQTGRCQLDIREESECLKDYQGGPSEVQQNMKSESLPSVLLSLDQVDLLILEAVTKADGMKTRDIGKAVHLSSKATLARAKKLVELELLTCQTVVVQKGAIQPGNLFFPIPELKLKAIQELIAQSMQQPRRRKQRMELLTNSNSPNPSQHVSLASLDVVSLLVLSLIGRGEANTVKAIQEQLQISNSPARKRISWLMEARLLERSEETPFMHRPGLKEYRYSLSPSVSLQQVQNAISQVNPAKLPSLISLEVFWRNSGLTSHSLNGKTSSLSTGYIETKVSSNVFQDLGEGTDKIWKILRAMAEKIAEYEDRIAKLEAREHSRATNEDPDAILALIPPRNS